MTESSSSTLLDRRIADWLAHQRALGRAYAQAQWVLGHLRRSLVTTGALDLDQAGFDHWCNSFRQLATTTAQPADDLAQVLSVASTHRT